MYWLAYSIVPVLVINVVPINYIYLFRDFIIKTGANNILRHITYISFTQQPVLRTLRQALFCAMGMMNSSMQDEEIWDSIQLLILRKYKYDQTLSTICSKNE